MIAFQHINNIIHDLKSSKEIIEENKKEFKRFYKLFKYLENNFNDYKLCDEKLEGFKKNLNSTIKISLFIQV